MLTTGFIHVSKDRRWTSRTQQCFNNLVHRRKKAIHSLQKGRPFPRRSGTAGENVKKKEECNRTKLQMPDARTTRAIRSLSTRKDLEDEQQEPRTTDVNLYISVVACLWAPAFEQTQIARYSDATWISNFCWTFERWTFTRLMILTCCVKFPSHSKQFKSCCLESWPNFEAISRPNYMADETVVQNIFL